MTTRTDKSPSKRAEEHAAMLKEALAHPGVREVMKVYGGWQQADKGLDAYRAASRRRGIVTTTDHATPPARNTG